MHEESLVDVGQPEAIYVPLSKTLLITVGKQLRDKQWENVVALGKFRCQCLQMYEYENGRR